ncbi:MAG: T9SS type A sorting domain-containing protein [Bacteroidetes bacterium]|nr:T9SS type A sorting domain-containing protein [Bacteroidota bacterium]
MRNSLFTLLLFLVTVTGLAQTTGIGQWRDHLPYSQCISVKEVGSRMYCATPYAVFYFDKSDNSIQRISKVNGLSDIKITAMNYNSAFNTLVIAYENANIDLIKNNTIINIADIKRASILGNKTINDVYFIGPYAYLSCGFGIVVLDVDKEEIHDTYYIGANGAQVNVFGLTKSDQDTLFAATEKGVYLAYAKSQNLANYQSWKKDPRLNPNVKYDNIINFNGQVVVSKYLSAPVGDSLYRYSNGTWSRWFLDFANPVEHMESTYGKLVITCDHFVKYFDPNFVIINGIYSYNGAWPTPSDAVFDNGGLIWIADKSAGLVSLDQSGTFRPIELTGPLSSLVFAVTAFGDDIYVPMGGRDLSYVPLPGTIPAIYHFNNTSWINMSPYTDPGMAEFSNLSTVVVDPSDPRRIYSGSWGRGLAELYDGKVVNRYGYWNSSLKNHSASDTGDIRVGGTAFDSDGNLWVVNSHNNYCISRFCRSCPASSQWTGYNVPIINQDDLGQLIIDHSGQKWVVLRITPSITSSLLVFKEDATNPNNSKSVMLSSQKGNGAVPGQAVFAMAVDKNGQVWVGTEKGIGVFFTPENIFTGQNFDAQQILVQQGAYVQYLMENEKVTAIAIDGANRKWIGSEGGGLYLFSEDGTKQISHFTTENSPLLSDNIVALGINPETGEVFIGTDQGLESYKGTATEGGETFSNVYAYPNPVKEDYEGLIGIKGLVTSAQVRITDIEGNLIFSTKAEGGLAVWDGKNFDGRKAKSGVYLVYAGNDKGTEKIVTKILILH